MQKRVVSIIRKPIAIFLQFFSAAWSFRSIAVAMIWWTEIWDFGTFKFEVGILKQLEILTPQRAGYEKNDWMNV